MREYENRDESGSRCFLVAIAVDNFTEHRPTVCSLRQNTYSWHTLKCISHPNVEDGISNLEDGFSTNSLVVWNIREHSVYSVCVCTHVCVSTHACVKH